MKAKKSEVLGRAARLAVLGGLFSILSGGSEALAAKDTVDRDISMSLAALTFDNEVLDQDLVEATFGDEFTWDFCRNSDGLAEEDCVQLYRHEGSKIVARMVSAAPCRVRVGKARPRCFAGYQLAMQSTTSLRSSTFDWDRYERIFEMESVVERVAPRSPSGWETLLREELTGRVSPGSVDITTEQYGSHGKLLGFHNWGVSRMDDQGHVNSSCSALADYVGSFFSALADAWNAPGMATHEYWDQPGYSPGFRQNNLDALGKGKLAGHESCRGKVICNGAAKAMEHAANGTGHFAAEAGRSRSVGVREAVGTACAKIPQTTDPDVLSFDPETPEDEEDWGGLELMDDGGTCQEYKSVSMTYDCSYTKPMTVEDGEYVVHHVQKVCETVVDICVGY